MRLARWTGPDGPVEGEVRDDEVVAFDDGSTIRDRLATGDETPAGGAATPLSEVTVLAPIARPGAIYGIGLNYSEHAAETGSDVPDAPIVFCMPSSASADPGGPVVKHQVVRRLDYEGELVIVLGADARIAGWAVGDDVSARDLQRREPQWTRAKGAATFCPWGPWITTVDELSDASDLRLRTWVNGDLRQDATTADLIHPPQTLVDFVGEACALEPGDLIFTGTPSGVGAAMDPRQFLEPGDVVRIEISGLGVIEHGIAAG